MQAERAQREGNLEKASRLLYAEIPALERQLIDAERDRARRRPHGQRPGHRRRHRRGHRRVDRHPGRAPAAGRDREAAAPRGRARQAADRAEGGREGGLRCRAALARGHQRPRPADRVVPVPRADGRRQDRAREGARRLPLRRRARHGAHRHVGVRREALRLAPGRRPSGLHRLRAGRSAHRGRAPPPVQRRAARRGREGAPRGVRRAAAGHGRRSPHRRPGSHGRLQERDPRCSPRTWVRRSSSTRR